MRHFLALLLCSLCLSTLVAQEKYGGGLAFDDEAYEKSPMVASPSRELHVARLPSRASVKIYAPSPGNQGQYNNCVGWSSSYAARTILFNKSKGVTQTQQVNANAFSPAFTYRMISKDNSCFTPVSIELALRSMKEKGTVPKNAFDFNCPGPIPSNLYPKAQAYAIKDYKRLFYLKDPGKLKLLSVKNALSKGNPVIIGMKCTPSFERADGQEVWERLEPVETTTFFGHAMCVVAYDNKKYGGAFQIMNSWGHRWGKDGFIWVRYKDFVSFVKYAYLPIGNQADKEGAIASSKRPETQTAKPKKSSTYQAKPRPSTQKNQPTTSAKSGQFGQTSSEVFDLAGEVKLILSDGSEMPIRLYGNVYRTKELYPSGTKFRIYLSAVKDAFVYVIGTDADYSTAQLFPGPKEGNARLIGGSKAKAIPDNRRYIQLEPSTTDRDYLCVIYSKKSLDMASIQRKIESAQGTLSKRIQAALGSELISARNIQYENGRIAFSALKDPGAVSTLIIETRRR